LEILKKARGRNVKQVLKYSKNGHTRKEKGQGNKWLGFGLRSAKKQAYKQKQAFEFFFSNEKGPATCCGVLVFNS